MLTVTLISLGRLHEAQALTQQWCAMYREDPAGQIMAALVFILQNNREEAEKAIQGIETRLGRSQTAIFHELLEAARRNLQLSYEGTSVAEMQSIADQIPGASFHSVSGAGHLAPLEQPAVVNGLIDEFLASAATV